MHAIYWKGLCHFFICGETLMWRSGGISYLAWANYLFPGTKSCDGQIQRQALASANKIKIKIHGSTCKMSCTTEGLEDDFPADTVFQRFQHQAMRDILDQALLASYLMLQQGRCVVPSLYLRSDWIVTLVLFATWLLILSTLHERHQGNSAQVVGVNDILKSHHDEVLEKVLRGRSSLLGYFVICWRNL